MTRTGIRSLLSYNGVAIARPQHALFVRLDVEAEFEIPDSWPGTFFLASNSET